MSRRLPFLSILLLVVGACDSSVSPREDFDQLSQNPALLVGTWEWQCDASFWSGGRCDPSSVSETETWVFSRDGRLTVQRQGIVEETAYVVRDRDPGSGTILFVESDGDYVFGVDDRRLVLFVDGLADGPERLFLRQ